MVNLSTNGITVSVETQYLPSHSNPVSGKYIFGYHISIENGSPYVVQLLRRHWTIVDGEGNTREVDGEGVIGEQPILAPGEQYSYSSYCDLDTEMGKMSGTYLMTRPDNHTFFDVVIPEFRMIAPHKLN